jgi:hypothetical protein
MSKEQSCVDVECGKRIDFTAVNHHKYKYLEEVVLVLKRLSEGHQASKIASDYFENDLNLVLRWIEFANDIGLIDRSNNNSLTKKGRKWQKEIGSSFWGSTLDHN